MNKLKVLMMALCLMVVSGAKADSRNFYHRIDVGSSNIYSFALTTGVAAFANYLTRDILVDNSYVYTVYTGDLKTKGLNPMGLTAHDMFNDCFAGVKLGYSSTPMGSFNWGIFGSAHYRINQVRASEISSEDYHIERFQYFKPGAGVLLTFGGIENNLMVQLEAAVRYDVPLNYKGMFGSSTSCLRRGVSSHYSR